MTKFKMRRTILYLYSKNNKIRVLPYPKIIFYRLIYDVPCFNCYKFDWNFSHTLHIKESYL